MCLILVAWRVHPDYPLVLAANRDEYHARPSAAAGFWRDCPEILGGRDLECMGTWLGVTRGGKVAAVTNYRDPASESQERRSRGLLASQFLEGDASAAAYISGLEAQGAHYRGFNFLAGDRNGLWWISNRGSGLRSLEPGIYGLSNHLLDTPWPKVTRGKRALAQVLETCVSVEPLMSLLADTVVATDAQLPDTGVGQERERMLSAARIISPLYGTRCSTVLLVGRGGRLRFAERAYEANGHEGRTLQYELALT